MTCTYSYGRAGGHGNQPTDHLDVARISARHMSRLGETWLVHEYPPGDPQPGKLIATYRDGEIVQPEEVS